MNNIYKIGDIFIAKNNTIFSPGEYHYFKNINDNTIELISDHGRKVQLSFESLKNNFELSLKTKLDILLNNGNT